MSDTPPQSTTPPAARRTPPPLNPLEAVVAAADVADGTVGLGAMFARNLSRALLLGLLPILIGLGSAVTAWVGSAMPSIKADRTAMYTAEADYHAALRQAQPLLTALTALGAPVGNLEPAWFAFEEAPDARLRDAADGLMSVLVAEVEAVRATRGDDAGNLAVLMTDATSARHRASDAWHTWTEDTSTLRGRALVLFGLAEEPPVALARYEHPMPGSAAPP